MEAGKILVSEQNNAYILKMVGDVRVNLCASFNHYLDRLFSAGNVKTILIDLLETEGVDSTTLGLLAKLGLYSNRKLGFRPRVFCTDPSILRTFSVMGIEDLFEVVAEPPPDEGSLDEIEPVAASEDEVRRQVLAAHKLLVEINPDCWNDFVELIHQLEEDDPPG